MVGWRLLRFGVLGPLHIRRDEEQITIPAGKQRTVLALLLIHRGGTVPTERLIAELWDREPPASARGTLQSLVSRLRRSLGEGRDLAEPLLLGNASGYALALPDGASLDLLEFEQAVAGIRARSAGGPASELGDEIDRALGLWRGAAFADVPPTPRIAAERVRLEEARLALWEALADIRLARRRDDEVIAQNTALVVDHPLRERLWEQLMLALYRSGRRHEALRVYSEAEGLLMAELGVDPGEELQRLRGQILTSSVPSAEPGPSVPRLPAPPAQLPPVISDFTGRETQLAEALATLGQERTGRTVAVSGMAGVGKTTFALQLAHHLRRDFPDGQIYVDLRSTESRPRDPDEVVLRFLRAIGMTGQDVPSDPDERAAVYRSSLADRRILLVLDNATDEGQVEPLLPGSPTCAVLVTSRKRLSGLGGARHIGLDVLSAGQALDLIANVAGPDRVASERAAATELVELCGRHPLSLRICSSRLAARPHWSIGTLTKLLLDERLRIDELEYGSRSVRASFTLSYEALQAPTRRLFCLLSLMEVEDFASWVAAPLLDTGLREAEHHLELLVENQLVQVAGRDRAGQTRYRFHDLIHLYGRDLAERYVPVTERRDAIGRLLGAWLALTDRAHETSYGANFLLNHGTAPRWPIPPGDIDSLLAEPWSWWESEHRSLVAVVVQAARGHLDEAAWDLAVTSTTLFGTYGYLNDWETTHEAALAATVREGNRRGGAIVMSHLAGLRIFQQRYADALDLLAPAADTLDQLEERRAQAFCYVGMGIAERGRRDLRRALVHFHRGHELLRGRSDPLAEAHVLLHTGQTYLALGDLELAEKSLSLARSKARSVDSGPLEGYVEHWLGATHLGRRDPAAAAEAFSRAITRVSSIGDMRAGASALQGLAQAHLQSGERDKAEHVLSLAGTVAQRIPDSATATRALNNIGGLLSDLRERVTAPGSPAAKTRGHAAGAEHTRSRGSARRRPPEGSGGPAPGGQ
ncbi:BTAD domain-containing putative transcriptional regulator [Spirillospora sp. NPDC049024]